jgi:hypothetical protein
MSRFFGDDFRNRKLTHLAHRETSGHVAGVASAVGGVEGSALGSAGLGEERGETLASLKVQSARDEVGLGGSRG